MVDEHDDETDTRLEVRVHLPGWQPHLARGVSPLHVGDVVDLGLLIGGDGRGIKVIVRSEAWPSPRVQVVHADFWLGS